MSEGLVVESVSKRYGDLQVLNRIDLQVKKGEFAAIVGPSGCGKSTVLRMAAGLEPPDSGRVTVGGRQVTGPSPDRMLIFQEHALYPWRTVAANIGIGLELAGISKRERQERVTTSSPAAYGSGPRLPGRW